VTTVLLESTFVSFRSARMIRVRQFPFEPGARPLPLQSYIQSMSQVSDVYKRHLHRCRLSRRWRRHEGSTQTERCPILWPLWKLAGDSSLETLRGAWIISVLFLWNESLLKMLSEAFMMGDGSNVRKSACIKDNTCLDTKILEWYNSISLKEI
jgi:hypothetical protein